MLETNVKIIKHKVGLLNLAEELGNVSRACKAMGLTRDTFYRYKAANVLWSNAYGNVARWQIRLEGKISRLNLT
jgi:ACT domain-containing protein